MRVWSLVTLTLVALPLMAGRGPQHQNCPMAAKGDKAVARQGGSEHRHGAAAGAERGKRMQGRGMGMQGRGKGMQGRGKGMQGRGKGMQGRGKGMQGRGMGMRGDNREHHQVIHSIMGDHASITRKVEKIEKGVRTETTSKDPAVAEQIRVHVRQMKERLEAGQPIRMFDPLFREIFANHDKIEMKIEDIAGGARVTETSDDPQVALLIRKHAEAVDGFVAEGMAKMHEPTALPEGYERSKK